jgi:hypothetical protein
VVGVVGCDADDIVVCVCLCDGLWWCCSEDEGARWVLQSRSWFMLRCFD